MVPLRDTTSFKFIHGKVLLWHNTKWRKDNYHPEPACSLELLHTDVVMCSTTLPLTTIKVLKADLLAQKQFHIGHDENVFHQVSK